MKKLFPIIITLVLVLSSCEKWLDINTIPTAPSVITEDRMIPNIAAGVSYFLGNGYMDLGYIASVYTHQLSSRESIDQYGIRGSDLDVPWANLYADTYKEIVTLIDNATANDNLYYAGIGRVFKAYLVSQMVDLWGEIPYSEAAVAGNFDPAFDDDQAIYTDLLAQLDTAVMCFNNTTAENLLVPGNDDIIYGGDIDLWLKAANSLKLKMYVQVASTSLYDQAEVNALLAGDLIDSGEDFIVPHGPSLAPDNRNPGFIDEWSGSQISSYISPWIFEIMMGLRNHIFTGIQDPRIPYYWVTQLDDPADAENPSEYQYEDFVSIYFGSNGVNRDHGGRNTFTMIGLYPVGGAYDSESLNKSSSLGASDGTGAAPYRMITYADILYLKGELIAKGLISGDLREVTEDAIYASFDQVDMVTLLAGNGTEPLLSGSDEEAEYIEDVMSDFDAASSETQFEILMTQKWISHFGSAIDSYTDYRRTGYPVMWDPNTMVADGGPNGSGVVPTESTRPYALSLPWSADELSLNDNAPTQKTPSSYSIFWDN